MRTFGPMSEGSLRSNILNLNCSAIGSGIFTVAYVFSIIGIIPGFIMNLVGVIASNISLKILMTFSHYYKKYSYSSVAFKTLGKNWDIVVALLSMIHFIGTATSYMIIINDLT